MQLPARPDAEVATVLASYGTHLGSAGATDAGRTGCRGDCGADVQQTEWASELRG